MKKLVLIALTGLLFGCSSEHDDLKTFMKCGIAANQLEQGTAFKISQKMERTQKEKKIYKGSARDAMYLGQEVRDEDELEGQSFEGQIETLIDIYNSSKCVQVA